MRRVPEEMYLLAAHRETENRMLQTSGAMPHLAASRHMLRLNDDRNYRLSIDK